MIKSDRGPDPEIATRGRGCMMDAAVARDNVDTLEAAADAALRRTMPDAYAEMIEARERRAADATSGSSAPTIFEIDYLDAREAGGTKASTFNRRIVREAIAACVRCDRPDAESAAVEIVETLKAIRPRAGREALLARRMVALDALCMENLRIARSLTASSPLRAMLLDQALELDRAGLALDEAIERRRGRGVRQRIVVERVNVAPGAQAIVGAVTAGGLA
jgi:hypothetical protein